MMQFRSPQNLDVFHSNFDEATVEEKEEDDIKLTRSLNDYYSDGRGTKWKWML